MKGIVPFVVALWVSQRIVGRAVYCGDEKLQRFDVVVELRKTKPRTIVAVCSTREIVEVRVLHLEDGLPDRVCESQRVRIKRVPAMPLDLGEEMTALYGKVFHELAEGGVERQRGAPCRLAQHREDLRLPKEQGLTRSPIEQTHALRPFECDLKGNLLTCRPCQAELVSDATAQSRFHLACMREVDSRWRLERTTRPVDGALPNERHGYDRATHQATERVFPGTSGLPSAGVERGNPGKLVTAGRLH